MPLPFSFSTQRQSPEGATPDMSGADLAHEMIMQQAPGQISTEPLFGTPGNTFMPPMSEVVAPTGDWQQQPNAVSSLLPPAPPLNQRMTPVTDSFRPPVLVSETLHLPTPQLQAPTRPAPTPAQDWSVQIEQLRNDIFGIAMNVSALSDRIERTEQRGPQAAAGLAVLRGEIETWLENHLNAAVEHCMHRIISRTPPPAA